MIIRIIQHEDPASRRANTLTIVDYIARETTADKKPPLHMGSAGMIGDTFKEWREEMADRANMGRSKSPVIHFILSWGDGERPTPAEAEEAALIFLEKMRADNCQAIWAVHDDTDHRHMHVAFNKVQANGKAIDIPFLQYTTHQAKAWIEHEHGWTPEARSLFAIDQRGNLVNLRYDERPPTSAEAQTFEHRTGLRSAETIAKEDLAQVIAAATTWRELHETLARSGAEYQTWGKGAVLVIDGVAVKASAAAKTAGLKRLECRLGPFQSRETGVEIQKEVDRGHSAAAESFKTELREGARLRKLQIARFAMMSEPTIRFLKAKQKGERERELAGSWQGRGPELNERRKRLAIRHRAEFDNARAILRADRKQSFSDVRKGKANYDFQQFAEKRPELLEDINKHLGRKSFSYFSGRFYVKPVFYTVADYTLIETGKDVLYQRDGVTEIVDRGVSVIIENSSPKSIKAALRIAEAKFGKDLVIRGDLEFRQAALQIAAESGIVIHNAGPGISPEQARAESQEKQAPQVQSPAGLAPTPTPAQPTTVEPALRPPRTRFRPEPFYKPAEQGRASAPPPASAAPVRSPVPASQKPEPKSLAVTEQTVSKPMPTAPQAVVRSELTDASTSPEAVSAGAKASAVPIPAMSPLASANLSEDAATRAATTVYSLQPPIDSEHLREGSEATSQSLNQMQPEATQRSSSHPLTDPEPAARGEEDTFNPSVIGNRRPNSASREITASVMLRQAPGPTPPRASSPSSSPNITVGTPISRLPEEDHFGLFTPSTSSAKPEEKDQREGTRPLPQPVAPERLSTAPAGQGTPKKRKRKPRGRDTGPEL